ncbi:hypothetical protein BLNAU_20792 [Blattamonas nauphoetae]|uniref:Uncharacterized protein n=1 Tax=Blattamonas nauphoetae TaxID=2049346 RepID=A0ABQ9WXR0_9EUKA|nr:hypothetical protein BLNAU_20792 [Blattamonas nauphoetae]
MLNHLIRTLISVQSWYFDGVLAESTNHHYSLQDYPRHQIIPHPPLVDLFHPPTGSYSRIMSESPSSQQGQNGGIPVHGIDSKVFECGTTTLFSFALTETTPSQHRLFGSEVIQRVVGCSVSHSTMTVITKGTNSEPTLRIPSSVINPSADSIVVVVVEDEFFEISSVNIELKPNDSSFSLLSPSDYTIVLLTVSLTGSKLASEKNNDPTTQELCEWESGIIKLVNSSTSIKLSSFLRLSQGAINMKGSSLTIQTSSFSDNTPRSTLFPSFRRNIRCSDEERQLMSSKTLEKEYGGDMEKRRKELMSQHHSTVADDSETPTDATDEDEVSITTLKAKKKRKMETSWMD